MKHQILFMIISIGLVCGTFAIGEDTTPNAYGQWKNGPPSGQDYFPIGVWLQDPKNAPRYQAAGINLYIGLWRGPTPEQLSTLKQHNMPVICSLTETGLNDPNNSIITGWMHGDEPDNAQPITDPKTGQQTYGPCVPPSEIVEDYKALQKRDPSRPILLNLGQGVANDEWKGRGSGAHLDDYKTYVQGCDIVSYDVYPVAGIRKPDGGNFLWYVAKGVDRLRDWTQGHKIIWNVIECTHISDENAKATPHQVRAEVWMSLIHGSTGIIYFVHEFNPKFNEHALLDDPEMLEAVTKINREIHDLAPVLNSETVPDAVTVETNKPDAPVAAVVKRCNESLYLFTVGMRNQASEATFTLHGIPDSAKIEVIGEDRKLTLRDGKMTDAYQPYDVHLYRIKQLSKVSP